MFKINYDGLSTDSIKGLGKRFDEFQHGTVLPSWVIRFCGFIAEDDLINNQKLGQVRNIRFYMDNQFFYVYKYENMQAVGLRLNEDFSEADVYFRNVFISEEQIDRICELIREGYRYRATSYNSMIIHSSSVIFRNEGILFFGYSGAGKSTQAELWIKYRNAVPLNYDQNCIILVNDEYCVSGTPWGGKEKYYCNKHVPVKAIVFVQKYWNQNFVKRMDKSKAFATILLHNYMFPLCSEIEDKYYDILIDIVEKVPVYILCCTNNEGAVEALYKELY